MWYELYMLLIYGTSLQWMLNCFMQSNYDHRLATVPNHGEWSVWLKDQLCSGKPWTVTNWESQLAPHQVSVRNSLLSAISLALSQYEDLQSKKTVEGSAKSCCCFQYIEINLCVHLARHDVWPFWEPQTKALFISKDPQKLFLLSKMRQRSRLTEHFLLKSHQRELDEWKTHIA